MRTFAIGDIHGAHKALIQCIERSEIDRDNDTLICLGDVADGWTDVPQCFDELLTFKYLIYVIGNHDYWLLDWLETGYTPHIWTSQGGRATIDAYERIDNKNYGTVKEIHRRLLAGAWPYHEEDGRLFVHGGYDWKTPVKEQDPQGLMWDRHLFGSAYTWEKTGQSGLKQHTEVFIGHTSTSRIDPELRPVRLDRVWNLDQGAGFEGKLTIMDVDSKEYWQSDIVKTLYPGVKGR